MALSFFSHLPWILGSAFPAFQNLRLFSGFQRGSQVVLIRQSDNCGRLPRKLRLLILQKCLSPQEGPGWGKAKLFIEGGRGVTPAVSGPGPAHMEGGLSL